ncbi:MAG: hypothetical protein AAGB27_07610 [Pseudomonadota bacterium]
MAKTAFRQFLCLIFLLGCTQTQAVRLSLDSAGQVLLFPLFITGDSFQTIFEVRNQTDQGKALRFVVKDAVNGRPTLSLNVYLSPRDSWSGALFDPSGASVATAESVLAPCADQSCTFPARADIPDEGIALSDEQFTEDLSDLLVSRSRLGTGYVEIYEMGTITAALAGDCAEISARWTNGGAWDLDPGQDIEAPGGGLEGYAVLVQVDNGRAHQYEAIALADFRDDSLHTNPFSSRQPNLADVSPAESRVVETVVFGNRTLQVERVSTWSEFPVHAVDALLMATEARADFTAAQELDALVFATLNFPTRPYHADDQTFFLPEGQERVLAPFAVSLPVGTDESLDQNRLTVSSIDREGAAFDLQPFPGQTNCDLANGAVSTVFLSRTIGFTEPCPYTTGIFRVPDNASEGEVRYQLTGEIVSDEGHVFSGLPIAGFVIQSIRNEQIDIRPGTVGVADYGWARALKIERQVSDPP